MNCLELTRIDAIFSKIAFGVFLLCRVQKFAENSRKIRKSIFEGKESRSQKTVRGGHPRSRGGSHPQVGSRPRQGAAPAPGTSSLSPPSLISPLST